MSNKAIMNNHSLRWFVFVLFLCSIDTITAQWGFTATIRVIGKDCEGVTLTLPTISGFPNRSICEQVRREVLAIKYSSFGCTAYYSCTACTGQDLNYDPYNTNTNPLNSGFTRQFTPGTLSINGTAVGQAYFTSNNSLSIQEWIDNVQQRSALIVNKPPIITTPTTEDSRFDKTYQNDMIVYIGESKSPISIDPNKMKVKTFDNPTLTTPDMAKRMEIANVSNEMQIALAELLRLERFKESFCNSSPSDCDYYQNKYNEANQAYLDAKEKLRTLKYEEYSTELNNYKQQLDKYKKEQSEQNEFWAAQTQKQIDYLNDQISKTTERLNSIDSEINSKIEYTVEVNSKLSWADKTEEIAIEKIRKLDIQSGELVTKLEKKEITQDEFEQQINLLSSQYILAQGEMKSAQLARATNDKYIETKTYINEKKEIAKDFIENTGEYLEDERVETAFGFIAVDVISTIGSYSSPIGPVVFGMYSEEATQYLDNKKIDHFEAGKDCITGIIVDESIDLIPNGSIINNITSTLGIFSHALDFIKSVNEVGQERIIKKQ